MKIKKLSLRKESLRTLSPEALAAADGAGKFRPAASGPLDWCAYYQEGHGEGWLPAGQLALQLQLQQGY